MTEIIPCSIIIPVLDEADELPSLLASLQAWRTAGHEVIVVDGGSSDDSASLARPLSDQLLHSEAGRATQMNFAATRASHDWLVFLHADTRLPTTAMTTLQRIFNCPDSRWGRFNVELADANWLLKLVAWSMNTRSCLTGIATGDQAMFVRRRDFLHVGGFPAIPLMEDITLSCRLKRLGAPHCLPDRVLTSSRRWREQGVLRTIVMMWSLRLRYFLGARPDELAEIYNRKQDRQA